MVLIGIFVALFAGEYAWVFNLFMIGGFTILVLLKSFNKKSRRWLNLKYDIDGFDYLGRPTGRKEMICPHQFDNCEYQLPFDEGAFQICKNEDCINAKKMLN